MIEVKGARGAGKTTMLLQRAFEVQRGNKVIYVSLDLPYFYSNSLFDLADSFQKMGGFADEIVKSIFLLVSNVFE